MVICFWPTFLLWLQARDPYAQEMIADGLQAIVTCIDPKQLDRAFVGRRYDQAFLDDLPEAVDPCGENGEFHTFVYAGPMFKADLAVEVGEVVKRDGFVFADVQLKTGAD